MHGGLRHGDDVARVVRTTRDQTLVQRQAGWSRLQPAAFSMGAEKARSVEEELG